MKVAHDNQPWEYYTLTNEQRFAGDEDIRNHVTQDELDDMGLAGWEMVTGLFWLDTGELRSAVFKRPKSDG